MKSSMLFAGIGLSALLLAACDNSAQEQSEKRAEQAMEYQENAKKAEQPSDDASKNATKPEPKMMETKPAQPSDTPSN